MAATGISERVGAALAEHGHVTPTSFGALTLGTIDVVYGDIGTSPLYALKESLAAATGHAGSGVVVNIKLRVKGSGAIGASGFSPVR